MTSAPAGLERFLAPPQVVRPGERCDMCREILSDRHSHVVGLHDRKLLCTCRACWLLFTREGAAQGRYKAVPSRVLYDEHFDLSALEWEELQVPVRVAFFFHNSALGRMVAFYPSPGGATESLLPHAAWDRLTQGNAVFSALEPDVEALLVTRAEAGFACFLVPIDACYELVGRVRRTWKGFDGGQEARDDIDAFFAELRARGQAVSRPGPPDG